MLGTIMLNVQIHWKRHHLGQKFQQAEYFRNAGDSFTQLKPQE
jgi:hypothetical protein